MARIGDTRTKILEVAEADFAAEGYASAHLQKIAEQEREIARLTKRAERAEGLVELQKTRNSSGDPARERDPRHRRDRHARRPRGPACAPWSRRPS